MNDRLYIILWRSPKSTIWHAEDRGVFESRRLAENFIECAKASGQTWDYAIVEGPIVSPETMEQAAVRLGEFA